MGKIFARAGALIMALLFLVTSLALSIAVIWQATHKDKTATPNTSQPSPNQLEGTKLSNFSPVSKIPKLQTIDLKAGSDKTAKASDTITVNYTGAVAATGTKYCLHWNRY